MGSGIIEFKVRTSQREEFVDITPLVQQAVTQKGVDSGICHIFVPHTTCGITINENADPDVVTDLSETLDKLAPAEGGYRHKEGNAPAHVKASLVGSSESIFIEGGRLCLGTWQGIFLCEFDGPRQRKVWVKVIDD
ncbi:MAG: hypothetical protein PWP65_877 [Clostridia bacterium]|nr:hypothetical protein [Clostridia bacterium]